MGIWASIKSAFGWQCTNHEWERYTIGGDILRGCVYCDRMEKLNPRAGVWMRWKGE